MVTRENEYHLRSLLLLHYGGSYITKKIIHRELPKHGGDLDSLLKSHQDSKIKHEFKNRKQLEKLFPLAGQADINKWDVQMLTGTILILFGPKLKYEEKESVRHIKYLRHELAHSPTVAMEEDEYKDFKERLYCAITELASGFEKSVMDDCAQLTKTYESCQLDATSYIEHLKELKDTDELFEKILEEIKNTKQSVCGDIKEAKSEICETVKQTSQVTVDKVTDHIQTSKMDLTNDIAENHKLMLAMIDKLNTMNQWHPFEKHISIVDSKLIFSGDEEAVQMAYTITSTVMNEAIKRTEGSKEKGKIREAVDDILSSFNAINGVKVLSAEMSCIVIKIQCDNYKSLHDLLAHITGNLYKQQLDGLSTALSDGLRKPVTLHSSIPSVCLQTILDEMGNTGMVKHQQLSLPIQCKTSGGVKNVITLFESDDFSAKLNKLSELLSEEIDKKINVDAFASNIYLKINNDEVEIDGEKEDLNDNELVEIKTLAGLPQYDMECEFEPRVDTVSCKKELHARPKDTCTKNKRLIVAAIEIGTTFTTYKYSYEIENKSDYLKMKYPAFKTPTVVLFDENDKFHSFGFEAEIKYAELKEKENDIHIQWKIFNDLSLKDQSNLFVVTDEQNRPMLALDVYAAVLKYLKKHLLNSLQFGRDNIDERDIQWIVSVPALWCSKNKELIAEAAEIACFSSVCLKFALQTDMTAVYCKEYLVSKETESRRVENQESLSFGTQIIGTGGMPKHDNTWGNRTHYTRQNVKKERERPEFTSRRMKLTEKLSEIDDKDLRILCVGPSRSGKSSFIDSLLSTFRHKIRSDATGGNTDESSATTKFQLYQIKYENETGERKSSSVYLADMPGIQEEGGLQLKDIKLIVKGHVANKCKIENGVYKDPKTKQKNRIHCVCFVFDLYTVEKLSNTKLISKCCELKTWLTGQGIPFVVVVTNCDRVSEAVRQNQTRIFEDRRIKECKDKLVELFRVKESLIYPVQNYINETTTVPHIEALLLNVIEKVFSLGYEHIEDLGTVQEADEDSDENGSESFKQ